MEETLMILGAKEPFDEYNNLSSEGCVAFEKLIQIVEILNRIGAIKETSDDCEKYFDEIIRLGF